jgi:phage-related protein
MLNTTLDIFWLVFAIVIAFVGIGLGFATFYFAWVMRDFQKIITSTKKKFDLVDRIMEGIVNKVENTANYIPPLIEGAAKLVEAIKERRAGSEEKPKKKKK